MALTFMVTSEISSSLKAGGFLFYKLNLSKMFLVYFQNSCILWKIKPFTMLIFKKTRIDISGEKLESVIEVANLWDAREIVLEYYRISTRATTFEEFQDKKGTESFRAKDKDGKIILELLWIPGR